MPVWGLMMRPAFLDDPALTAVLDALPEARVVGGAVRDALAGRKVADVDLATPLRPEAVVAALKAAGLRSAPTGLEHGTVTAISHGQGFEVTTLRRDVATDGRRATVAFSEDWAEDAARRDFTINAMFMDRDGAVLDLFGGQADLAAGRVRFVGDAATRIAEDYLRILRFFRFWARYGRGAPDPAAMAAIRGGVPGLAILSAERVWSEIKRILEAPEPGAAIALMAETGVLAAVLPEARAAGRLARLTGLGAPVDPLLRLSALLDDDADLAALASRLRLSHAERATLTGLRDLAGLTVPGMNDGALRAALVAAGSADVLGTASWRAQAAAGGDADVWTALRTRIAATPVPVFGVEGRDVVALGVAPGPEVGRLLRLLRDEWAAGGHVADADTLRARLAALVRGPTA